jgi:hypothetical protein
MDAAVDVARRAAAGKGQRDQGGKQALGWFCELVRRILPHSTDAVECLDAVQLALSAEPEPPPDLLDSLTGRGPVDIVLSSGARPELYDRPGGETLRALDAALADLDRELRPRIDLALAVSTAKAKGRWVTIGGVRGEDGKRHGGSPVYIENGRITKGAPALTGRKIDALKEGPEETSHRQDVARERSHTRAVWAKKARREGIDPGALHQLAGELLAHDREMVEGRLHLLRRARELLGHYGYDARALTTNLRSGRVEDEIPALDVVADSLQRSYPEHFAGHGDPAGRLVDLLTEGNPEPMAENEAYEVGFEQLQGQGGADPWQPSDEPIPFSH